MIINDLSYLEAIPETNSPVKGGFLDAEAELNVTLSFTFTVSNTLTLTSPEGEVIETLSDPESLSIPGVTLSNNINVTFEGV